MATLRDSPRRTASAVALAILVAASGLAQAQAGEAVLLALPFSIAPPEREGASGAPLFQQGRVSVDADWNEAAEGSTNPASGAGAMRLFPRRQSFGLRPVGLR
jgi:hypothetical protein